MQYFKEIPLLFSTPMVQAIMEGRKTQTRRTRGLENVPLKEFDHISFNPKDWPKKPWVFKKKTQKDPVRYEIEYDAKCPYGKPGDLIWVREKTIRNNNSNTYWPVADGYVKTSDYEKITPSIHMPKSASRRWLMVEEIRLERLQDISGEDILYEGVRVPVSKNNTIVFTLGKKDKAIDFLPNAFAAWGAPKLTGRQLLFVHWAELWCDVNGRESWNQNPWVWVVKFRILSITGRPSDEVIMENHMDITEKEATNA
jgi:hypothetical protein